jgi:hypothetical protein
MIFPCGIKDKVETFVIDYDTVILYNYGLKKIQIVYFKGRL